MLQSGIGRTDKALHIVFAGCLCYNDVTFLKNIKLDL